MSEPVETASIAKVFGDEAEWRQTVVNWLNQLKRVIDDYLPFATISQAVQKDGIQNSWDGRENRRHATNWRCVIELHVESSSHRFVTITDSGTTGLTGRVLTPEEYETYMPEEERWARFESHAFTHEGGDGDYLGARGQGKFIFVGASKSRTILYDTLRRDRVYRLGARRVTKTSSPIAAWEGERAVERLREFSPDLAPLDVIGTRVIIDDPVDELVEDLETGRLAGYIADTWWPILEKYDADIRVAVSRGSSRTETRVSVPDDLKLPIVDSKRFKSWFKENQRLDVAGDRYTVKRVHFVHDSEGPVRPELAGVALVRGGMVVMRLEMPGVPTAIAASVTGYVEFDERLDNEMKRAEHPTHYTFNLRRGVGYKVKRWVEDELARFAAEKLGVGGDRHGSVEKARREAEKRALEALNRKARELGLVGTRGRAGGGGGSGGGGSRPRQLLAVKLDDPIMPVTGTRRVEFGQTIGNIRARAVNNTDDDARVRISIYLTRTDTLLETFVSNVEFGVAAGDSSPFTRASELTLNPEDFLAGPYVIRAKLLVISSPHVPKMWEQRDAFKFWLAEDPPQGGLFEDVVPLDYPPELVRIDAEAQPGSNGWIFQYNLLHPAFTRVADDEEELTEYLFELMVREMVYVDLRSDDPVLFEPRDLEDRSDQQKKAARVIGSVLYDFYGA